MIVFGGGASGGHSVTRAELLQMGLAPYQKRPESQLALSPPCVDTARACPSLRTGHCWHPGLRLPAFGTVRKEYLLFKPHGLWQFVITAQTKTGITPKCTSLPLSSLLSFPCLQPSLTMTFFLLSLRILSISPGSPLLLSSNLKATLLFLTRLQSCLLNHKA